jgi:hypothetical protein
MHEDEPHDDPGQRCKLAAGLAGRLAAALACGALVLAACGGGSSGPQVAGSGSSPKTASSSSKGSGANPLAYAACMRSHGLPDFPDPDSSGGFALPGDIDPNSPRYQAAENACKAYAGPGLNLSPARQEQIEASGLKFAQCMRSHGVPSYADPTFTFSGGGVSERSGTAKGSGPGPNSPTFQAAQKTCQGLTRHGGGNGG